MVDRGPSTSKLQRCGLLLRNLLIATLAYTSVVGFVHVYRTGSISPFSQVVQKPAVIPEGSLSGGVNWRLRPESLVKDINDAYLGARPDVDTYANYTRLIEACRGSAIGLERMRNVHDCLKFLAEGESDYFFIPEGRPSQSVTGYPTIGGAAKPNRKSSGECPGPVQLYHTYWTGPSQWRVELFVKSYLYTQNLPCSRLYIWLDSDSNPKATDDMMKDPGFARFLPLVERGDIMLMAWKFPSRIPLPKGTIEQDPHYAKYLSRSGSIEDATKNANAKGETYIGDGLMIQKDGSEWIVLTERQMTFLPVAVSDAVRFVVLHLYGGVYLDMDILLLRDMRPLLLTPDHNFAERWAVHSHAGDFNTAVLSLNANSSLSSYLVRGGVRMGLNFHPRIVGRMAWKDGRVNELAMFETGLFDPIWGEFNWGREGRCAVPCFKDYGVAFVGTRDAIKDEWQSYDGAPLPLKNTLGGADGTPTELRRREAETSPAPTKGADGSYGGRDYRAVEDKYPPNNRTLENFFRGAWTYHIHNQWLKHPQPNSWFDVIERAQDGFFRGERTNPYGERWEGPEVKAYERWPEFD
ncbi:hypothetical protein BZA05DRAFT_78719 [Tricharina praecox]|uniref:uncharacterized protein n=1 Tax=Tricharina praecox TaxID=43433 RepID=UPI00221EC94A|nr:uncharacterized protein BZA05DRAFT_78719 [Tricharina praecox]KAI5849854.1 hypothetical protein BZA05DRAFT_78719 [Tricharina praecox]